MKNLIAVIGPTGVGKSKLAIELAHRFKGEIVNADSMQVYKGLDIITNKVSREEMAGIRHCLMDYVDPFKDAFTVQDWTSNALKEIQDIQDRGKVAILVGGTHYYLQSILTLQLITVESAATHQVNQVSQEIMGNLKEILDKSRLEPNEYAQELSDLLRIIDPIMGNRWHPRDGRKIRRSLEVFYTTGMRQSDIISKQKLDVKQRYRTCIVWPFVEKEALEKRLDDRIEEMIDMGLVKEIQDFYDKVKENGFEMDFTRGIFQAIGFKEFQEYFRTNDPKDFKTGVELMKLHTRQYAKSQVKWIKNKLIGRLKDQISFISLDLTDLNAWEENSLKVSEKVEEFLKGKDVQVVPHSYLVDYEPLNTNIIEWKQFKCEICTDRITKMPRIFNGEHEWKSHLDSRIHRRNAQKKIGYKNNRLLCDAR
jgi:tRNA dimethylallyltransferase